jgi:hypothetical protein
MNSSKRILIFFFFPDMLTNLSNKKLKILYSFPCHTHAHELVIFFFFK